MVDETDKNDLISALNEMLSLIVPDNDILALYEHGVGINAPERRCYFVGKAVQRHMRKVMQVTMKRQPLRFAIRALGGEHCLFKATGRDIVSCWWVPLHAIGLAEPPQPAPSTQSEDAPI